MKNTLVSLLLLSGVLSCKAQIDSNWDSFLSHFPKRSLYCLDSLDYYFKKHHGTLDTIANYNIHKYIWDDEFDGPELKIDNEVLLIDDLYRSPIFGSPWAGNPTYPISKIDFKQGFILVYLAESMHFRAEGYNFNLHVFNNDKKHISGLAFEYAPPHEPVTDLVYPEVIDDTHFLVTNILAEQLVNPNMSLEKWLVNIREDGMLHVVWMRSNWADEVEGSFPLADDYVEIRSVYDYYIEDPDGYTNLRQKPTTQSKVLEEIPAKQVITVVDISKKWWTVKTKAGNIGYVHKSRIAKRYK